MSTLSDLQWMLPPFAICLVLVGIHGYLGIHVLERKVIFVDLALAQIAALGTTYAFMLGYDPKDPAAAGVVYSFSLGFTVLGAAVFAATRMRHERVPHEAFIGITYATASALVILILAKSPAEGEHLKSMLVGNVLLVTWPHVIQTAAIYAAVGLVHAILFRRFREISEDPDGAAARGIDVRFWDFLFYVTFGFVITSSVAIAGVLLVFTYLVVPASFALLFVDGFLARIAVAWTMGTICSLIGVVLSYYADLPTGPTVVATFAGALVLGGTTQAVLQSAHPGRAALAATAAVAMLALSIRGSFALRRTEEDHRHGTIVEDLLGALESGNETAQVEAIHHLTEARDAHAAAAIAKLVDRHPSDRLIEHAARALGMLGDPSAVPALLAASTRDLDPDLELTIAEAIFTLRDARGMEPLIEALRADPPLLTRRRAAELVIRFFGQRLDYRAAASREEHREALAKIESWWQQERGRLRWLAQTGRFE
jgi:zinc/manganese transport system permease protein